MLVQKIRNDGADKSNVSKRFVLLCFFPVKDSNFGHHFPTCGDEFKKKKNIFLEGTDQLTKTSFIFLITTTILEIRMDL